MPSVHDGPATQLFKPVPFNGNAKLTQLPGRISPRMAKAIEHAPAGPCTCWGIPFVIDKVALVKDEPVEVRFAATKAPWLVFMHTSDVSEPPADKLAPLHQRKGRLGERLADYVILYADGREERVAIRQRFQINAFTRGWGPNAFEAVGHNKPRPNYVRNTQRIGHEEWGEVQTRTTTNDLRPWMNWLWAWPNPRPQVAVVGVRVEPAGGTILISAISAGRTADTPLRWRTRRKCLLTLPEGLWKDADWQLDAQGLLKHVQLDMGQVISAEPQAIYPNRTWTKTYSNRVPDQPAGRIIVEYTSHADACFHLPGGRTVPVAKVEASISGATLSPSSAKPVKAVSVQSIAPSTQRVTIRAIDKSSGKCVPVKLHVHGQAGEYLAPVDRHRYPNPHWYQDYSADFTHQAVHHCSYIDGEAIIDLPLGNVYVEVSKGFEIEPVRKAFRITRATRRIDVPLRRVLNWRGRGWVTADTHVHFLSPTTARLEGAAEGVNIINLLASQWGELMTNVGDFDGKTTFGSRAAGGDGEHMVRVGTENRQHVLGHISLLGYDGRIIAPMTTGGPDEAALGDPVGTLLTDWARQCRKQGGIVVAPHFPNPPAEHAATLIQGDLDGVEMTSWGDFYSGINPYSLADWYRFLNCGCMTAAVGGTDKMSATTAVGTVRTYARIDPRREFTYETWKDAIRRAETFVTYGPLMEFAVEGRPAGSRIAMTATGGTVDATWELASVMVPMSRVELIRNGEIIRSEAVGAWKAKGSWPVKIDRSSWLALLVRGHYKDKPEIIAAHSSPVMVEVKGSQLLAAANAMTILEQIEGAITFLDNVGTRDETANYKRMRFVLTSAHRTLHNRMHAAGHFHEHTPAMGHR